MLSSKDIRELNEGEINTRIAELEEERFRLRFRAGTETLEDPLRLRVIRKDVARLKTVLKEKIIGIDQARGAESTSKAGGAKTRRVRQTKSGATRASKRV
ncbi:MAG TPA: 50S ribosomal protein L29 [Gemmatimonadaceae bacterium]|jgi:large subunit ribosomal protein L29|nr:50S ribosomal protein L29 [Gemmatimonadaceae bacterium]